MQKNVFLQDFKGASIAKFRPYFHVQYGEKKILKLQKNPGLEPIGLKIYQSKAKY